MSASTPNVPKALSDEQHAHIEARIERPSVDGPHMRQVAKLALLLYDALRDRHRLQSRMRVLLEAGALLHDIGFEVNELRHHKHSRDMILKHPVPGMTQNENQAVACLARYHRKASPTAKHKEFAGLSKPMQRAVTLLAAILRIADGLDRSHCAVVRGLSCQPADHRLIILLDTEGDAGIDLFGAERKKDLFEEVFGMSIEFRLVSHLGSPLLD